MKWLHKIMALRGRGGALLLLAGMVIAVLVIAGSVTVLHKTSETAFCVSCHSMEKPLAEYMGSIHYQNHAGIRAECSDCHVPKQPIDYITTKIAAVKDIFGEITGKIATEEKFNAQKLAMAESVWKTMKANDSATCRSCHRYQAMDILAQRPDARKAHPTAMQQGQTCIDCHRGVAHILPDMRASNSAGAKELLALAAATPETTHPLYTVATHSFSLQPEAAPAAGTLFPATELTPLARRNGWVEARLEGWQQQDVPGIIYAAKGKRIISAVLGEEAAKAVTIPPSAATEQAWRPVSLSLWLPSAQLVQDRQAIWRYASGLMSGNCTGCHGLTQLNHFTANQWPAVIKSMASRTSLDREQLRLLTQFTQYHASDMTASAITPSKGADNAK